MLNIPARESARVGRPALGKDALTSREVEIVDWAQRVGLTNRQTVIALGLLLGQEPHLVRVPRPDRYLAFRTDYIAADMTVLTGSGPLDPEPMSLTDGVATYVTLDLRKTEIKGWPVPPPHILREAVEQTRPDSTTAIVATAIAELLDVRHARRRNRERGIAHETYASDVDAARRRVMRRRRVLPPPAP